VSKSGKAKKQNNNQENDNNIYKEIDITSIDNINSKSIGCEYVISDIFLN